MIAKQREGVSAQYASPHPEAVRQERRNCYDYDHAASHALIGLLDYPAALDISRCEAHRVEFSRPVRGVYGHGEFRHGVLLITRGHMGKYAQTMGVYATDSSGALVTETRWDGSRQWFPLSDAEARTTPMTPDQFLRRAKLPIKAD